MTVFQFGMLLQKSLGAVIPQRTSNACYFEAVSQTVMNEDASRQRKNLSLVLQPSEWRRKNQTVVIAMKFVTVVFSLFVSAFLSETFVCYKLFPVHHNRQIFLQK